MNYIKKITTLLMVSAVCLAYAQIAVLNIPDGGSRCSPNSDPGYNLNGTRMVNAKAKLTNTSNFGTSGVVPYSITITDGFANYNSINSVAALNSYNIIYIGNYACATNTFSATEISYLLQWSKQPGKVLLLQEQSGASPVSAAMGYTINNGNTNPTTVISANDTSQGTKLFSGVFGNASTISQGGTAQGYFVANCTGGIPIANNAANNPTVIFNRDYRDVLVADTDFFTNVSNNVTAGGSITSDADKIWTNLWAWAINEVVNNVPVSSGTSTAGGTASTNQSMPIPSGNSVTISLDNNTASVKKWQTSTDGGNTWTDIASTQQTITYANPVNNQKFRAVTANSASCPENYSTQVTVTVCAAGNTAPVVN